MIGEGVEPRLHQIDEPGEGLVAAVRMESGGELVFRFDTQRTASEVVNTACADAISTVEINQCYDRVRARAAHRRLKYAAQAKEFNKERPVLVSKIQSSEEAFEAYREAECEAVYEDWKEGTIRGLMSLACNIDLTDKRTKVIWKNWLTYIDSTPPLLPEPQSSLR